MILVLYMILYIIELISHNNIICMILLYIFLITDALYA
jgi:hypothetical protein